jgi:outer membrane protein OmpA-like peptidoglycan-associated protein
MEINQITHPKTKDSSDTSNIRKLFKFPLNKPLALAAVAIVLPLVGCTPQTHNRGSSKISQIDGTVSKTVSGAISGGITGSQLASATGPGVAIGAALGGLAGGAIDLARNSQSQELDLAQSELATEEERARSQAIINSFLSRRLNEHSARALYPADLFFAFDGINLTSDGEALLKELSAIYLKSAPWSRLRVVVYMQEREHVAVSQDSFALRSAELRARAIGDNLVKNGIEGRRVDARVARVETPLYLRGAGENPGRYSQAVEFIEVDS